MFRAPRHGRQHVVGNADVRVVGRDTSPDAIVMRQLIAVRLGVVKQLHEPLAWNVAEETRLGGDLAYFSPFRRVIPVDQPLGPEAIVVGRAWKRDVPVET